MKRYASAVALCLVVAACGGSDGDASTTSTADVGDTGTSAATSAQTTTTSIATTSAPSTSVPQATATGDFCEDANNSDALIDGIDFFSDDIESEVQAWLAAIDQAAAEAPAEIADDVAVFVAAVNDFADVLADANYDFTAVDPSDPRILALDDGRLDQASANVAEYCGWEDISDTGSGDTGATGQFGNDPVPDNISADLVPTDIVGVDDNGAAGVNLATSQSYDDVAAFYVALLGAPATADTSQTVFSGVPYQGSTYFVLVEMFSFSVTVVTLIALPV